MNPILGAILRKYQIAPAEFFLGNRIHAVARREAILELSKLGLPPKKIAYVCKCHVNTVYFYVTSGRRELENKRRNARRAPKAPKNSIGGPKQTPEQRREILEAYLADRNAGTVMAVERGLSPLYAYKLAKAMGAI